MAQLQKKVNDQEQANRSLAQQLEEATSQGQIRTTRFGATHRQDRRAVVDPTRLVLQTPGNTTRPVRRTAPEIGRDRTEPIILGNWETNRNEPQLPPPRAEVTEADHIDVSDNEEYAREQAISAIKLSLAKAENEMKLVRSQMHRPHSGRIP